MVIKYENGEEKAIAATNSVALMSNDSGERKLTTIYVDGVEVGAISYNTDGKFIGYDGEVYTGSIENEY